MSFSKEDISHEKNQYRKRSAELVRYHSGLHENVSKAAVAIAWILRHPAKMQAIIGTMNMKHIKDICTATDVKLSHHDWYFLYLASGKFLP